MIKDTEAFLHKKFKPRDGPFFQSLGNSLEKIGVQQQAYHGGGGSFVGNHCHELLKVQITHMYKIFFTEKEAEGTLQ